MNPMMMGGMPPQDPMGGMGGGQLDPQILAALMATMGGGAMPNPGMPAGPGMSMEDSASFAPGTGGTTPMTLPQQPIADTQTLSGPDPSSLLQALMGMTQGGAQMGGQMPVGGAF